MRIFPIGIGSPNGAVVDIDGFQVATALDADLLRSVAERSGGTYFAAGDAAALRTVVRLASTSSSPIAGRNTEITAIFAGVGLLCSSSRPGSRCAGTGG